MSDVTIKYKGQPIATMDASGAKTLNTQGKYCEANIGIEYVKPSGGIDVSGIVSYYQQPVLEAMDYVNGLGDEWVNNLVVTDTHFKVRNCRHSAPILALMFSTGKFDKIIHMGDATELATSASDYAAFKEDFGQFNGDLLLALGNHDAKSNATASPTWTDFYNDFLSDFQGLGGTPTQFGYYYDNAANKIRYIVYKYSPSNAEAAAACNAIATLPDGWTYVLINHYPETATGAVPVRHRVVEIMNKRPGIFINGHMHYDIVNTVNGVPQITMMSDCLTNPGAENPRVAGNVDEHAITILSINPTRGEVKTYRIGCVYDSSIVPANLQLVEDNPEWLSGAFLNGQGGVDFDDNATHHVYGEPLELDGANDEFFVYCPDGSLPGTVYLSCFSSKAVDAWLNRVVAPAQVGYITPFNNITPIKTTNANSAVGLLGVTTDSDISKIKISHGIAADMPIGSYADLTSGWDFGYAQSDAIQSSQGYQWHPVVAVEPETTYRIANDTYTGSSSARIGFQSKPAKGYGIQQLQPRYTNGYWEFTTPANAHYALISLPITDDGINRTVMYLATDEPPVLPERTYTPTEYAAMGYLIPNGTKQITENGTVDVSAFANAFVNVTGGGGGGSSSNMAMGTYTATGSEAYLVAEDSSLGDILGGVFFREDLSDFSATGSGYTVAGALLRKLNYSANDVYRAESILADGGVDSYSIVQSRFSSGKLEFFINANYPLTAGAKYTWVIFGKQAS